MKMFTNIVFKTSILLAFFLPAIAVAQLQDNFTDGDFTANPVWAGDVANFIVNPSQELQLNAAAAGQSSLYVSAPTSTAALTTWDLYFRLTFAPSTSNYLLIYLAASQATLTTGNAYVIKIGDVNLTDAVRLYRQGTDITDTTLVAAGTIGAVATNPVVRLRVTRDTGGNWSIYADYTGGNNLVLDGTGTDATYPSAEYFGVTCKYTVSNITKFYFDDIIVNPVVVDQTPPQLLSASGVSLTQVDAVFSEPLDAATAQQIANYNLDNGVAVTNAALDGADPTLVHLTVAPAMVNLTTYQLTAQNIEDLAGNAMAAPTTVPFTILNVAPATYRDIVFNELIADPTPVVGLPDAETVEFYNRSANPIDLGGMVLVDNTGSATLASYILMPGQHVLLCDDSKVTLFNAIGVNNILPLTTFPTLTNGGELLQLQDANGDVIDSVHYDLSWYTDPNKAAGGWTLELSNPELTCSGANNWHASIDPRGGTPGSLNTLYTFAPDIQGPALLSATQESPNTVRLTFDEGLDDAGALNVANYAIAPNVSIASVVFVGAGKMEVLVTVGTPFTNNTLYTLTVSNLQDCSGNNVQLPGTASFTALTAVAPSYRDLVFNEILADPTPLVGMPDAEFVEFYNRSANPVQMGDLLLVDNTGSVVLAPYVVPPGQHVLLCDDAQVAAFNAIGVTNILSVGSFPTLTNGGELLQLQDANGNVIDSVNFNVTWYNDATKDDGGWSLELSNPEQSCVGEANWHASEDPSGGTPGRLNTLYSLLPDTQGPSIVSATQVTNTTVRVTFNETLDDVTALNAGNYSFSPSVNVVSAAFTDVSKRIVLLTTAVSLVDNTQYTLTVGNVEDCSGNVVALPGTATFTFYQTQPAVRYDIIINEIFADYTPTYGLPEKDFVELYNRSNKVINLDGYLLTDGTANGAHLPYHLLRPGDYVICYSNSDTIGYTQYGTVLPTSPFPILDVGGDDVVLYDPAGNVIDAVPYTDQWYLDASKADGGWTLERINPNMPCEGQTNWRASQNDLLGGTPGQANSVLQTDVDNQGPSIVRVFPFETDSLRVFFSEALDEATATNLANYLVDNGLTITTAYLEMPLYNSVVLGFSQPLTAGTIYRLSLSVTLTDCLGNPAAPNETRFALPESAQLGDIAINEVLFNPVTYGSDFVELYNRSQKIINLGTLVFANTTLSGQVDDKENVVTDLLFFPGDYFVITPDAIQVKQEYYTPNPNFFLENALPSYPDDAQTVLLLGKQPGGGSLVIDEFSYSEDYHSPLLADKNGVSLERISTELPAQDANNWHSAATAVGYATPAYRNSAATPLLAPDGLLSLNGETFSPDGDGYEDFLIINYAPEVPGYMANVRIYDARGRLVRNLADAYLLGPEGFLQWDGTSDDGAKVPIGIYLIDAEMVDPNGEMKKARLECVVAGRL